MPDVMIESDVNSDLGEEESVVASIISAPPEASPTTSSPTIEFLESIYEDQKF